jgi:hypothetical protein
MKALITPGISSFYVGGPSPSAWRGGAYFWYVVKGSPVMCCWRELVVSELIECCAARTLIVSSGVSINLEELRYRDMLVGIVPGLLSWLTV